MPKQDERCMRFLRQGEKEGRRVRVESVLDNSNFQEGFSQVDGFPRFKVTHWS